MILQYELSTLPKNAITILRFMGTRPDNAASYLDIMHGTGLSDRAAGKSVKRLVTRFFMRMDESRIYHLAPKGEQAVAYLSSDEYLTGSNEDDGDFVTYDLCAVVPKQIIGGVPVSWMLGVNPAGDETPDHPAELLLRVTAETGTVEPIDSTLHIDDNQISGFHELSLTADDANDTVRIRVEVYQFLELDEPNMAGGMYFDIPVGMPTTDMRAVHTSLSLM